MKGDARDEPPHPRNGGDLERVEEQAAAVEEALARGRMHHAWLLTGPRGAGKASFAYHVAARLLGAKTGQGTGPFGASPDDPVRRMIAARSHPDLIVLERDAEDLPPRKSIPVDEARRLPEFFSKAPAIAAFRVAVIDAADDLNVNAANAVLKTLEEPSGRGVLLLVSHSPGQLLTTIRSRCRRLAFQPWPQEALAAFTGDRLGLDDADAERLAKMAQGAPGRVLSLAAAGALEIDDAAAALMHRRTAEADAAALQLINGFRGVEGQARFGLLFDRLAERLHRAALVMGAGAGADSLAQLWQRASSLPGEAEGLNLDRADAFWSFLAELRGVLGRHPLAA